MRETVNEMKMESIKWEKIFANHIYDQELIHKCIENSINSIANKATTSPKYLD
jgi:hypothetical protein